MAMRRAKLIAFLRVVKKKNPETTMRTNPVRPSSYAQTTGRAHVSKFGFSEPEKTEVGGVRK